MLIEEGVDPPPVYGLSPEGVETFSCGGGGGSVVRVLEYAGPLGGATLALYVDEVLEGYSALKCAPVALAEELEADGCPVKRDVLMKEGGGSVNPSESFP